MNNLIGWGVGLALIGLIVWATVAIAAAAGAWPPDGGAACR